MTEQLVREFVGTKSFEAYAKAAAFLTKAGFSIAPPCGNKPIGYRYGEYTIEYWSKMTATERYNLHGVITAKNMRLSPVIVTLYSDAPDEARNAFKEAV